MSEEIKQRLIERDAVISKLPKTREDALSALLSLRESKVLTEFRDLARVMERTRIDDIIYFHSQYNDWKLSQFKNVLLVFTFDVNGNIDDGGGWISNIGNLKTVYHYHSKSCIVIKRSYYVGYKSHSYCTLGNQGTTKEEHINPDIDCELYQPTGSVGQQLRSDNDIDELKELEEKGFVYQPCSSFDDISEIDCNIECNIVMTPQEFINIFKDNTGCNNIYTQDYLNEKVKISIENFRISIPQSREEVLKTLDPEVIEACKEIKSTAIKTTAIKTTAIKTTAIKTTAIKTTEIKSNLLKLYANDLTHGRIHRIQELKYIGITIPYYTNKEILKGKVDMKSAVKNGGIHQADLGSTTYIVSFNDDSIKLRKKYILCPVRILLKEEKIYLKDEIEIKPEINEPLTLSEIYYRLIINSEEWVELTEKKILLQAHENRFSGDIDYFEQTILFTTQEFLSFQW